MQGAAPGIVRTPAIAVVAVLFFALAVADLTAVFTGHDTWRPITKALLMPALIAIVLLAPPRLDRVRVWLVIGLVWSTLGDVLLLSRSDAAFVEGTLAFAAAHVAFIVCFTIAGTGAGLVRKHPWVALPYLIGWLVATAVVAPHMGALAFVAVPYSLLLTVMALVALNLVGRIPLRSAILAAAGAALFMSSDTNIAMGRFVPSLAPPHVEFLIMLLYIAGQALIVAAFVPVMNALNLKGASVNSA